MNAHNYTTPRLSIARREIERHTLEANKARLKLDFATDPNDIAHWEFEITLAETQVERWRANVAQMEAEHAATT